jgi:hypothetical protein
MAMVITAIWAVTPQSLVVITLVPAPTAFLQIQVSLLLAFSHHLLLSTLSPHLTQFFSCMRISFILNMEGVE